jgi:hypothetical protein
MTRTKYALRHVEGMQSTLSTDTCKLEIRNSKQYQTDKNEEFPNKIVSDFVSLEARRENFCWSRAVKHRKR